MTWQSEASGRKNESCEAFLRHLVKLLSAVLLGALIGVNGVAFMQVWAMTHFAESGERTARPEQLSIFDKITILLSGVNIPRPQNRRTPADLSLAYETHHFASPNATPLEAWYIPGNGGAAADRTFSRLRCEQGLVIVGGASFPRVGFRLRCWWISTVPGDLQVLERPSA